MRIEVTFIPRVAQRVAIADRDASVAPGRIPPGRIGRQRVRDGDHCVLAGVRLRRERPGAGVPVVDAVYPLVRVEGGRGVDDAERLPVGARPVVLVEDLHALLGVHGGCIPRNGDLARADPDLGRARHRHRAGVVGLQVLLDVQGLHRFVVVVIAHDGDHVRRFNVGSALGSRAVQLGVVIARIDRVIDPVFVAVPVREGQSVAEFMGKGCHERMALAGLGAPCGVGDVRVELTAVDDAVTVRVARDGYLHSPVPSSPFLVEFGISPAGWNAFLHLVVPHPVVDDDATGTLVCSSVVIDRAVCLVYYVAAPGEHIHAERFVPPFDGFLRCLRIVRTTDLDGLAQHDVAGERPFRASPAAEQPRVLVVRVRGARKRNAMDSPSSQRHDSDEGESPSRAGTRH